MDHAAPPAGWVHWNALTLPDPLLTDALRRTDPPLCRRLPQGGFALVFPYLPGRPFPLVPLFCLARPVCLWGRWHLLFAFDGESRPILPHNLPELGNTTGSN